MSTVEIPYEYGPEAFDLTEVLAVIEPFAHNLHWYLIEFDPSVFVAVKGNYELPAPAWVLALWRSVEETTGGVRVDWQTLQAFSTHVTQTADALVIALKPEQAVPPEPLDLNSSYFTIVLQAHDATLWAITSEDNELLGAAFKRFPAATTVEKTYRYH